MRIARLSTMKPAELRTRTAEALRNRWDHARTVVSPEHWQRGALLSRIDRENAPTTLCDSLAHRRWHDAHNALVAWLRDTPQRFVIGSTQRDTLAARINAACPDARGSAQQMADRLVNGVFDLLGYRELRFGHDTVDWHFDPVSGGRPPRRFWTEVPYLDAACGDHKVIWELNRHQHWMRLGRAAWLTGDPRCRATVLRQFSGWIAENPPLVGINWASMLELGFRSISWLWTMNFFGGDADADTDPWLVDMVLALDRQLTHIEQHLSLYFSPNTHLLGEALALYVSGRSLPFLAASDQRQALGRRILIDEQHRQIAPDGSHREQSPHYHRYTMDFYALALTIARITNDDAAGEFESILRRLTSATRIMADQHGRLPHIGDDDGGMLLPLTGREPDDVRDSLAIADVLLDQPGPQHSGYPEEAFWMLAHPGLATALDRARSTTDRQALPLTSASLPDTGYYVSRSANMHLVVDAGPHGYLNGGHAHADALSLTMTVGGMPLLIDGGTACYTSNLALRDQMRSSAMHNTLTIDERSQSVPRGPFHWAHTADAIVHRWHTAEGYDYLDASHSAYAPVIHRRHVLAVHDDIVFVADFVDAAHAHKAQAHWHFDRHWDLELDQRSATLAQGGMSIEFAVAAGTVERFSGLDGGSYRSGLGWHAPVYGRLEPVTTLRVTHASSGPFWMLTAFGFDGTNAIEHVEFVDIDVAEPRRNLAARINRRHSVDLLVITDPSTDHRGRWSAEGVTSDARVLFCRRDDRLTQIAAIEASDTLCAE